MRKALLFCAVLIASCSLMAGDANKPILQKGQRVAIVGDSITEQKMYSRYIELYLLACLSHLDLNCVQFGWSGETANGFVNRMNNDMMPMKPNVVTTCYGMNDGSYRPYEAGIGANYEKAMATIVQRCKEAGITMVVGSPGAVDNVFFKRANLAPTVYNDNLSKLRDIAKKLADANGMNFANVHDTMIDAMVKAQQTLGEKYDVCGGDGFHPNANGQLLMALAFLKGMGIDGQIGTITVDLKGGAEATEGHKVLSAANGKVELESSRWPFCFSGDEKSSGGTRSIVPFCSFNQDLNRYVLVVKNLDGDRAKITWGADSKEFSKADLEKGINLTEHFFRNPFVPEWSKLEQKVLAKQNFETPMIKEAITRFPGLQRMLDGDKESVDSLENIRQRLIAKQTKLAGEARAAVVPVKHTVVIEVQK
jgi:lysophospholipase L1-like esterase